MRVEDSIHPADILSEALRSEIGAGIDDPTTRFCLDVDRGTKSLVAWIRGLAHVTIAANHRHTDRGGRAEKGDAQLIHFEVEVAMNSAPT